MTYPVRQNLIATVKPTPYANPLLLDLVPATTTFFLGIPVSGVALVGKGGASGPYSYSCITGTGSPPQPAPGVTLNANGTITGTPTTQGVYSFVAQVEDSASNTFQHGFTIKVQSGLFGVNVIPPKGEESIAYRFQFLVRDASGITLTSGFALKSGDSLPDGLSISAAGVVSGTPTSGAVGVTYFTIVVTDGSATLDIPCQIQIFAAVSLTFAEDRDPPDGTGGGSGSWLPSITRGLLYTVHLQVSGGVPPYSFSASDVDPLPDGIVVNPAQRVVTGKTMAASSTDPILIGVGVTDALGGFDLAQRAVLILEDSAKYIQFQCNGVNVGPPFLIG